MELSLSMCLLIWIRSLAALSRQTLFSPVLFCSNSSSSSCSGDGDELRSKYRRSALALPRYGVASHYSFAPLTGLPTPK